ncbi:MAG: Tab2/Atab2 family RNA-binding protein [Microcoleaceae cyanobacterium]
MQIWQIDFFRRPLVNTEGQPLWELFVCHYHQNWEYVAYCPQPLVNTAWLTAQLEKLLAIYDLPEVIQVFRPQTFNLMEIVGKTFNIKIEATRHTEVLKGRLRQIMQTYSARPEYTGEQSDILALEQPPPYPLPESLWGDRWQFASLPAGDIVEAFTGRPIPILVMPKNLYPLQLSLSSQLPIPGVIIDGGRNSLKLAKWIEEQQPHSLKYMPGEPDGLILEAGLVDRWVLTTFTDRQVTKAGKVFSQRQQDAKGLHFLLIRPDDSGMTYTAFWLLSQG